MPALEQAAEPVQAADAAEQATTPKQATAGPTAAPKQAAALTIHLLSAASTSGKGRQAGLGAEVPRVVYNGVDDDTTINARMATAIGLASGRQPRIVVLLTGSAAEGGRLLPHEEQHAAIVLLDALCLAFS
jgi:hypothetical protein